MIFGAALPAAGETTSAKTKEETEESMESKADALLAQMSLDEQIYQLFIVKPEAVAGVKLATKATQATQAGLKKYPVGGIVYFSDNLLKKNQVKEMIANSQAYAQKAHGIGLFIGVDEEGGSVARVAQKLGTTKFGSMKSIGARGNEQEAYNVGATIAKDISSLGFNLDFAPVADVIINGKNTEIGARSFGTDPALVSKMVSQVVKGLQDNGVISTLKHFPGHGSTTTNSHYATSITDRTLAQMEKTEFLPFQAGIAAGAEFVMISHLTAINIDKNSPASLSKTIITGLLREKLKYEGLIITDSLTMKAVSGKYTSGEAAVRAITAGADMLLMPSSLSGAVKGIQQAIKDGRITKARIAQSVRRILLVKLKYGLISE
jgi:beta-N-acetylhexosaminidase